MDYIISKTTKTHEIRVYKTIPDNGEIMFKGHKLSIPYNMLVDIIDYKYNLTSDKYFFPNYTLMTSGIPEKMDENIWEFKSDPQKDIEKSWDSLLRVLSNGKWISKISIVKVNI